MKSIKVLLPDGEASVVGLPETATVGQLKELLLGKAQTKGMTLNQPDCYGIAVHGTAIKVYDDAMLWQSIPYAEVFEPSSASHVVFTLCPRGMNMPPKIKKFGFLTKQGGKHKTWKKRWFVLTGPTLEYFENEKQSESKGRMYIGCYTVQFAPKDLQLPPNTIQLMHPHKDKRGFYMHPEDEESAREWIDAIQEEVDYHLLNIFERGIDILRSSALELEGIFRLSGATSDVEALKESIVDGDLTKIAQASSPYVVAATLKYCLRDREPLLTYKLYETFCDIGCIRDAKERVALLKPALSQLPPIRIAFLHYLCSFLKQVTQHSSVNKMAAANLAIVFGPNLLRPEVEDQMTLMNDSEKVVTCVAAMIEDYNDIFCEGRPSFYHKDALEAAAHAARSAYPQQEWASKITSDASGAVVKKPSAPAPLAPTKPSASAPAPPSAAAPVKPAEESWCVALHDFKPTQSSHIALSKGSNVLLLQKYESGWWKGSLNGTVGYFPSNYVRELDAGQAPSPTTVVSPATTPPVSTTTPTPAAPTTSTAEEGELSSHERGARATPATPATPNTPATSTVEDGDVSTQSKRATMEKMLLAQQAGNVPAAVHRTQPPPQGPRPTGYGGGPPPLAGGPPPLAGGPPPLGGGPPPLRMPAVSASDLASALQKRSQQADESLPSDVDSLRALALQLQKTQSELRSELAEWKSRCEQLERN